MTVEAALGTDARVRRTAAAAAAASRAGRVARRTSGACSPARRSCRSHRDSPHLVQDAYSLRCAPQVHGATRDALAYVARRPADRGRRRLRQPDRAARRRRGPSRAATSTASRSRWRWTRSRSRRSGWRASANAASTGLLDPNANNGLPAVPGRGQRAELRLHARAVHGGVARLASPSRSRTRRRWIRSRRRRDRRTT